MPDISGIALSTTTATSLANLVLVSPQKTIGYQPQAKSTKNGKLQPQPPAILFHYEGEQQISLESDITDHYVEDNSTIQDQIALRPEQVVVNGYIGELNTVPPRALETLKSAADKLTIISAYTPSLSLTALRAYNLAFAAYQVLDNAAAAAISAWGSVTGKTGEQTVIDGVNVTVGRNQTKQALAFQQFYGYWKNRTLFTVQTPWAVFQNMAIKSLRATQSAETRMITDFEVTFKLVRFANTVVTPVKLNNFDGRAAAQASPVVDLGTSAPAVSNTTLQSKISAVK
jgi:hypothetical protein